jgi:hypothetical protein
MQVQIQSACWAAWQACWRPHRAPFEEGAGVAGAVGVNRHAAAPPCSHRGSTSFLAGQRGLGGYRLVNTLAKRFEVPVLSCEGMSSPRSRLFGLL